MSLPHLLLEQQYHLSTHCKNKTVKKTNFVKWTVYHGDIATLIQQSINHYDKSLLL